MDGGGGRRKRGTTKIKINFPFQCRALSRESVVVIKILKLILIQIETAPLPPLQSRLMEWMLRRRNKTVCDTLTLSVCDSPAYCVHHFSRRFFRSFGIMFN